MCLPPFLLPAITFRNPHRRCQLTTSNYHHHQHHQQEIRNTAAPGIPVLLQFGHDLVAKKTPYLICCMHHSLPRQVKGHPIRYSQCAGPQTAATPPSRPRMRAPSNRAQSCVGHAFSRRNTGHRSVGGCATIREGGGRSLCAPVALTPARKVTRDRAPPKQLYAIIHHELISNAVNVQHRHRALSCALPCLCVAKTKWLISVALDLPV